MNLVTGEITGLVRDTHRSADFIDSLKEADDRYSEVRCVRIVLDNYSVHVSKETRTYLATKLRCLEFVFTPKYGSWLNLVGSFFGKLPKVCFKGIRVQSKKELVVA